MSRYHGDMQTDPPGLAADLGAWPQCVSIYRDNSIVDCRNWPIRLIVPGHLQTAEAYTFHIACGGAMTSYNRGR